MQAGWGILNAHQEQFLTNSLLDGNIYPARIKALSTANITLSTLESSTVVVVDERTHTTT